jgi:hypothetical protein
MPALTIVDLPICLQCVFRNENGEAKHSMISEHRDIGGGLGEECDDIKLLKGGLGVSASGWRVRLNPMTPRPIAFHYLEPRSVHRIYRLQQ